ncbi:MAG: hypothetical protein P1P82_02290 [Bacteroidales bacterium]|nr:hypothetical protein [Bacteroidales bacterium]MDT8431124.1 hypothetical protein [Bacteroidales bacterium]
MKLQTLLLIFTISLGLLSCEKYDEGGSLANADKNISETLWKIESAYDIEDNADITEDYTAELWEFTEDGIFKINAEMKGTYAFSADMKTLFISNNSGTEADMYTVERLDKEAMWLILPGELELHFVPNA